MSLWPILWTAVFAITLLIYAILAVVVTFGGWQDIRSMLRKIDEQHNETK